MADAADELAGASSALTRSDLLRRGAAAAFAVSMFGGLTDRALGVYGPLQVREQAALGELRIMTWAHFVPDYDKWLDGTYAKQWGEANDVEVKIDHINNALLYSTGAAEVAAQSGHDLFWFISPPASFQKQAIPMTDLVQEVSKKVGRMSRVAQEEHVQPEDEAVLRLPGDYAPDPVQYRRSFLQQAGVSLNTWDDLRKGAPKLKAIGHPVGLGMSNEIDSNMLLTSLLYCYGGFIQNEENRIVIGQGSNRKGAIEALQVMQRHLQATACRTRSSPGPPRRTTRRSSRGGSRWRSTRSRSSARPSTRGTRRYPTTPGSPRSRAVPCSASGNEHVMGVFLIWKFAKNKEAAKKYLVDQQLGYQRSLRSQQVLQLPAVDDSIKGGFKTIRSLSPGTRTSPRASTRSSRRSPRSTRRTRAIPATRRR